MTQGDLVMSMDQLLTKPRLGTCHKFYMQPFTLANSKKSTSTLHTHSLNTAVRLRQPAKEILIFVLSFQMR